MINKNNKREIMKNKNKINDNETFLVAMKDMGKKVVNEMYINQILAKVSGVDVDKSEMYRDNDILEAFGY
jgi:hypothetical protein|tara:strand:+ start:3225 stop:3434 length:210 start_codon:yes stop_codon:yes gene_type:complete